MFYAFGILLLPCFAFGQYQVVGCNDGDTCRLRSSSGEVVKVRLVGIDAPECGHGGQPFCEQSKKYLNDLVAGKSVSLKTVGKDRYSRTLGVLRLKDLDVNEAMIAAGFAESYVGKSESGVDVNRYQAAQDSAKKQRAGMWSQSRYESPYFFRKRQKN